MRWRSAAEELHQRLIHPTTLSQISGECGASRSFSCCLSVTPAGHSSIWTDGTGICSDTQDWGCMLRPIHDSILFYSQACNSIELLRIFAVVHHFYDTWFLYYCKWELEGNVVKIMQKKCIINKPMHWLHFLYATDNFWCLLILSDISFIHGAYIFRQ